MRKHTCGLDLTILFLTWNFVLSTLLVVHSFSFVPRRRVVSVVIGTNHHEYTSSSSSTSLQMNYGSFSTVKRRNVRLPLLLDLENDDNDGEPKMVVPLPSSHLPTELSTLHVYGMEIDRAVPKMIMKDAVENGNGGGGGNPETVMMGELGSGNVKERAYGHLVWKPPTSSESDDTLVGAIGCAADILISAPIGAPTATTAAGGGEGTGSSVGNDDTNPSLRVLCRGSYRFVVKEVLKTVPYPVVIVDELLDDEEATMAVQEDDDDDEDEDDDDDEDEDDFYADMDASALVRLTLATMKRFVDQQLNESPPELSPLEKSILEESGVPFGDANDARMQAEEMAAVLEVFQSSLLDIAPMPMDRYYSIAMMAAEIGNLNNDVRRTILQCTNGVERLRTVLTELDGVLGMAQARKMANSITDQSDEDSKDLKVGTPQLPPWSRQIKKGTRIEYYWNEEWEWSKGEVVEDPVMVLDELVVTVKFDADGEVHRLPFQGDEKARWRPG